ncbi:MAG: CHAT domain-containing protein, partial [Microcystaceae cyanobacterium]
EIEFASTVDGGQSLTVNTAGLTQFGDEVGGVSPLTSLTTNEGGTTQLNGNVTTTSSQTYNDVVILTGDVVATSNNNEDIEFASTVDGEQSLTINTAGLTRLGGDVGGVTPLNSLTTNEGGTTQLNGNVTTTGSQTYNDAVTLTGDVVATSIDNEEIEFANAVDGEQNLTINAAGITQFGGNVGGESPLTSLTTNAGGITQLNGNVTTTGSQIYQNTVRLTGDSILTGSGLSLSQLEGQGNNLTLTFSDAVSLVGENLNNLSDLTVSGSGGTNLGGSLTTSGSQTYENTVTLTEDTTLTGTNLTLKEPLAGNNHSLTFAVSDTASFSDLLNLTDFTLTGTGVANLGSDIMAQETINLNLPLTILTDSTISSSTGEINATAPLTAVNDASLTLSAAQNITTEDITTNGQALTISNNGEISMGSINTSGGDGSGGDVTISAPEDIQLSYINAQGGTNGVGGTVNITSEQNVRLTDTFVDQNGVSASVSSAGGQGGGDITIRHGGDGSTPFVVGDASVNGSAGAITSGNSEIEDGNYLFTERQGNVAIISVDNPIDEPIDTPDSDFGITQEIDRILQARSQSESESESESSQQIATNTLTSLPILQTTTIAQTKEILSYIVRNTEEKPGMIYIRFVPPLVNPQNIPDNREFKPVIEGSQGISDRQLADIEAELTGEYANFLNVDNIGSLVTQEVPDDYELEILLITEEGQPFLVQRPGVTRGEVLAQAQALHGSIQDLADYKPFASQLYQWIMQPVAQELEAREVTNVVFFMPSGLRLLPLAALYDEEQGEFVAQKPYSVGFAPSINFLDYRYTNLNNASILAFGASEFTEEQNQTPLPGVATEIEVITDDNDRAYLNEAFNLTNFKEKRANNPFPIIHLATHADFIDEDPSQSYIQLYNEKLTLSQWRELNLRKPVTDLLVISACNTAYGNSEIELGFGGLAVQTGVKTVVASLWAVGDLGTLALMTEFYRSLQESPTKAQSLQMAQQAMISGQVRIVDNSLQVRGGTIPLPPETDVGTQDLSHPFFWAPFTIIGSPW